MSHNVERLFPFVLRSRSFIVGRQRIERSKSDLQWILITEDISQNRQPIENSPDVGRVL